MEKYYARLIRKYVDAREYEMAMLAWMHYVTNMRKEDTISILFPYTTR